MNLFTLSVNHLAVITRIHPENAGVMWCSLNNHLEIAEMSGVYNEVKELKRERYLKYLGITFDRSMCGNNHVTKTIMKARKGLVAIKTMAIARMSQKILAMLFQILVLSINECGIGLLTLS